jgi:hypothetical protein
MKARHLLTCLIVVASVCVPATAQGAVPKISFFVGDINYFNQPGVKNKDCKGLSTSAEYNYLNLQSQCTFLWSANVKVSGRLFLQVFEEGFWIKITESKRWDSNGFSGQEKNGISVKNKVNGIAPTIRGLSAPRNEEAVRTINRRLAIGDLCYAQDPGPLRYRMQFIGQSGSVSVSNEVRITYKNYENLVSTGYECKPSKNSPQNIPQSGVNNSGAKLPPCTISQVIDLRNYIDKREEAYEIRKNAALNLRIQQNIAESTYSRDVRNNAYASIDRWMAILQQAAGVGRRFELLFEDLKTKCSANDVTLPTLAPIE